MGFQASRCASATSTGRARTRTARPASWRSSAARLLAGSAPTVFGDGGQTRDYVYVGDVVAAMLAAGDASRRAMAGRSTGRYNVGTGVETSVLDLVDRLGAIVGRRGSTPVLAPARAGEVQRIAIDPGARRPGSRLAARIDLADGLAATIDSIRDGS